MDPRRLAIDPSAPTKEEIDEHNYKVACHNQKVAKANLASNLAEKLCSNPALNDLALDLAPDDASAIADFSIAIAEKIIETYSLLPDAARNKGGLVS